MIRTTLIAAASLAAMTAVAMAAPERIRGTVESVDNGTLTVKTAEGNKTIAMTPDTKYAWVVNSSLDEVKDGKFIGTATKGDNPPTALEVVVFPASMNGTAEGHYAWDSIDDTTKGADSKPVKSKMTNGTIKSTSSGGAAMTKSKMTNGTVKQGEMSGADKMITVTYGKGDQIKIAVPPTAPIVGLDPADKAIVTKGATLFAVAAKEGDKLDGKLILVGKGDVKPPM